MNTRKTLLLRTTLFALLPALVCSFNRPSSSSFSSNKNIHEPRVVGSRLLVAKGFGTDTSTKKKKDSSEKDLKRIYSAPALYDLAMGYRNYESEVEFLLDAHKKISGTRPKSVIEVASGPGRHCMQALTSGLVERGYALDSSLDMVEYGIKVSQQEMGEKSSQLKFLCEDMRSFTLEEKCDSAWILAGSLQHMTTNEDVIATLSSINHALSPQGTLIVELPHPNELFQMIG